MKKKPIVLSKSRKFTIGRATKNSLPVREGTISEHHASIKWEKSSFKIRDERSTNGTFVNNKPIIGLTILKNGDRIRLGNFVLRYGIKKIREKKPAAPKKKSIKRPTRKARSAKRPAKRRTTAKRRTAPKRRAAPKRRTAAKRRPAAKRSARKRTARKAPARRRTAKRRSPVTRVSRRR